MKKPKLTRLAKAFAAAALMTPLVAHADPFTLVAFIVGAAGYAKIAFAIMFAGQIFSSVQNRRKARRAEADAKAKYISSLQDRNLSALGALPYWRIRYGRGIAGGDVINILTTDKVARREDGTTYVRTDAYKHMVVEIAHHEVHAIHEVYIEGEPVGTLDAGGFPTGGAFFTAKEETRFKTIGGGGTVATEEVITGFVQAYVQDGFGEYYSAYDVLGSVSGIGTTTITGPANAVVTYKVANNLSAVRIQKHLGSPNQRSADSFLVNAMGGAALSTHFNTAGNAEGWSAAGVSSSTVANGVISLISNSVDPMILSGALSFSGNTYRTVRARIKRTGGSSWDGACYYTTGGHGYSASFVKSIAEPTYDADGWAEVEWDMSALTVGGSDWISNTITGIRLDLGNSSGSNFDIDWIDVVSSTSEWNVNHRLSGAAYVVITLDLEDARFQGGIPNPTFDTSGKRLFDPRTSLTAYSMNPALVARDYLISEYGYQVATADIDNAYVIASANACDARVDGLVQGHATTFTADATANTITFPTDRMFDVGTGIRVTNSGGALPGGLSAGVTYYIIELTDRRTFKLATSVANAFAGTAIDITTAGTGTHTGTLFDYATFTFNGMVTTGDAKESVLEEIGDSMAGAVVNTGNWLVQAGFWSASVMDLAEADLDGVIDFPTSDTSLVELFNSVRGTYVPRFKSTPVEYTSYQNATFITADQGVALWDDKSFPFTDLPARVRNLARIRTEQNRNGQTIYFPAKLRAWPLQIGDRVRVSSAEYGLVLKHFRVVDWQFTIGGAVGLTLQEDTAATYDLSDAAVADPTPNTSLPSPWVVSALGSIAATSSISTGILNVDGSWVPRIKVTWAAIADPYVTNSPNGRVVIRYRTPRSATEWLSVEVLGSDTSAFLSDVREGDPVVIVAAAKNGLGQFGPPVFLSHTVTVTQTPSTYEGTVLMLHGTAGALSIIGSTATKIASGGAWNAGVYSKNGIQGGCFARATFATSGASGGMMLGLNDAPSSDSGDYVGLNFAIYQDSANRIQIYENAALILDCGVIHVAGDTYSIQYDNIAIRYYRNATLLYHRGVAPGLFLHLDTSHYTLGGKMTNIEFGPLSAAPRGNLLDSSVWVVGTSGNQGAVGVGGVYGGYYFRGAGDPSSEDTIVLASAPDGVLRPLWRATSSENVYTDDAGAPDGGFYAGPVPIDHTKVYRFSVWVNARTLIDGSFFIGPDANQVAGIATGTPNGNPYFTSFGRVNMVQGRWYLLVGFVLPSTFGTTPPNPAMGAVYDGATGQNVGALIDYKWVSGIPSATLRTYQYYSATGNVQDHWGPRLEMCDGSEPTVDQLLAVAKTGLTNNLQPDFESQFGLNGQFTNWALGAAGPDGWSGSGSVTITRETTITRTGPNAVRLVSPGGAFSSLVKTISWAGFPLVAGSFVDGTLDTYLVNHASGSGYPGLLVRCYADSGLTVGRDTVLALPNNVATGWQTIAFKASVLEGERIYGVTFFLLASWTGINGSDGANDVVFDSLVARAVQPSKTPQISVGAVTTKTITANGGSGITWPNSSSDSNPYPINASASPASGEINFVHAERQEYSLDVVPDIIITGTTGTTIAAIEVTIQLGYRNITTNGTTVALGAQRRVHLAATLVPGSSTSWQIRVSNQLTGLIDSSAGLTIGHSYKAGLYAFAIRAYNSSGTQIAPGAAASYTIGSDSKCVIYKA
jgi:hypothetical protein